MIRLNAALGVQAIWTQDKPLLTNVQSDLATSRCAEHVPKQRPQSILQSTPVGKGKRAVRLSQIQEQVGRGEYHVDTHAVADAIVRKLLEEQKGTTSEHEPSHGECS